MGIYKNSKDIAQKVSLSKFEVRYLGWLFLFATILSVIIHLFIFFTFGKFQINKQLNKIDKEPKPKKIVKIKTTIIDIPKPIDPPVKEELHIEKIKKKIDEFDLIDKVNEEPIKLEPIETPQIFDLNNNNTKDYEVPQDIGDIQLGDNNFVVEENNKSILLNDNIILQDNYFDINDNKKSENEINVDSVFKSSVSQVLGKSSNEMLKNYISLDEIIKKKGKFPLGKEKIALPTDILFAYNEFKVKEQAKLSLMKLAYVIQTNPNSKFIIEGHTDSFGEPEFNYLLSLNRAKSVRNWLVEKLEIDVKNVSVIGLGETKLLVSSDKTKKEQKINRRVEITIKTKK